MEYSKEMDDVGPRSSAQEPAGPPAFGDDGAGPDQDGPRARAPADAVASPAATPPSPYSATPFRSVGFTVSSIGYAVARRFRGLLAPVELEPREFALLRAVAAHEGRSQQAVGDSLAIPPSRMVAFVDALEERGLLERRRNLADRRARALHLTQAGREALARGFSRAVEYEQELCAELSDEEREELLALLGKVAKRLGLAPGVHSAHGHAALPDE